jgi:O-methyltransferase involved in polyketide biosynthesis
MHTLVTSSHFQDIVETVSLKKDMMEKVKIELGNIQRTLLLPLWVRAVETRKKEPLLVDKTSVEIVEKIDFDFSAMSKDLDTVSLYGWIRRSLLIDEAIRQFIDKHPKATVVNIGCGLDTTFERIDNGTIRWYDLDMPDTIELRRKFIQENHRRQYITSSFLDFDWLSRLIIEDNILFIAAGVFYYFDESQIKDFFHKIADLFSGSEIVFDAASPIGVKMANKMVIRMSGMDKKSFLKWGVKSSKTIQSWDDRIVVLNEVTLFKNARKGHDLKTKIGLMISDIFKMQYLIHLKIKDRI